MDANTTEAQPRTIQKLRLLNEIGRLVLESGNLDALLQDVATILKDRLVLQNVMIGTVDYGRRRILQRGAAGVDLAHMRAGPDQGIGEGIIGEAIETGRTIVINDVSKHARYLQVIPSTRSEMCVPFKDLDQAVGFLNIESDRLDAFERSDVELLEAVGSFLGQAVRNAQLRAQLEESRHYLESLVQNAGDAIVTFDREGRIRTWNRAAERILGQSREKVMCRNVLDLVQGSAVTLQSIHERVLSGETVSGLHMRHVTPEGSPRTLELSMAPVLDGQGEVAGISCILRDITRKIEAEVELQRSLRAMQLLNETSVELASILDLDSLLQKIAQIVHRFIDYELFAILLLNEHTQEFEWKTSIGYSDESYRSLQRLSTSRGVVGRCVRTRQPVIVEDVSLDPDYLPVRTLSGEATQSELAVPLIAKDRIVGALVLESTRKGYFRPHHLRQVGPLASQIAVSIENASLYDIKSRDALAKQVMNEIAKEMAAILELDELLNRIAVLLRRVIEYELLGLYLYDREAGNLELKIDIGYEPETIQDCRVLSLRQGIAGHAAYERTTILSRDLAADARAIRVKCRGGRWTQSEVAVPITSKDQLLGVLVVESCDIDYFRPEHVQILETLASQMAVSIENARLFEQLIAKEQKLEADFAMARDMQKSMLPAPLPGLEGFDVASHYKPAESLGGDYYDFIWLGNSALALAIGDVSGKGVAAAMSMAATRSALRFAARVNTSPSQVLYHVNRRLYRDIKKRTYVTLFYGVLDLDSRTCRWSNAGHFPPILLRRDGTTEELAKGGTVLALFDRTRYASSQTRFRPGDLVCFYTDGVTEAQNPAGEEFGKDRLLALLKDKASGPAREIVRALTSEIRKFARGAAQHDDLTIFILKAREGS